MDDEYVRVCDLDDLPDIRPYYADLEGRGVLVCRIGGEVYAIDEICPHEDRSMRYGVIQGGRIICPHHQYKFDLETGRCRQRCPPATIYDVEVEDGTVYVRAPWMDDS